MYLNQTYLIMKKLTLVGLVLGFALLGYSQTVEKMWETDTVFSVPESTLFDDSVVYVSNVSGSPLEKNGQGFISRITSTGEILHLKWVSGLHAPKGMGVYNNKLYVSDIDRVAVIDRKKGEIIQFIDVPGSKFLNDISVSESGLVAVSDMQDETIHFIENDKLSFKIKESTLANVNGLCWVGNILHAGTSNFVYQIDMATKKPVQLISDTGGIDGLEKLDENRFVISDWQGKVQLISASGEPIVLFNTTNTGKNAADIGLIAKSKIILVPTFFGNTVAAYQIVE